MSYLTLNEYIFNLTMTVPQLVLQLPFCTLFPKIDKIIYKMVRFLPKKILCKKKQQRWILFYKHLISLGHNISEEDAFYKKNVVIRY